MTRHDALQVGKLAVLTLIAWILPPRFWRRAAMATTLIGHTDHCWPAYKYILGRKYTNSEIADISTRRRGYLRELKLQILGLSGPWRSWRPAIRLNGIVHLRRSLEDGRGAILWVTDSVFATLIVKMALHNAGYQACQLTRLGHGFSPSSFGMRFLNPLWTKVEDRFIAERIQIVGESAAEAIATLRARLAANEIVLIEVGPQAHKFAEVPFFHAQLQLPTGPIRLASTTGAALFSVFAVTKNSGSFEVSIHEPLYPTNGQTSAESIAAAYAKRLQPFVLKYPDQWRGWYWLASRMCPSPPSSPD
jgi:predicted LPLAT superfamily acyltransferase